MERIPQRSCLRDTHHPRRRARESKVNLTGPATPPDSLPLAFALARLFRLKIEEIFLERG